MGGGSTNRWESLRLRWLLTAENVGKPSGDHGPEEVDLKEPGEMCGQSPLRRPPSWPGLVPLSHTSAGTITPVPKVVEVHDRRPARLSSNDTLRPVSSFPQPLDLLERTMSSSEDGLEPEIGKKREALRACDGCRRKKGEIPDSDVMLWRNSQHVLSAMS